MLRLGVMFALMLPSMGLAEVIDRDRSAEMERIFHFCRNDALLKPDMMRAITQAEKTLNGLCECIASNFVAALSDNVAAAARRGDPVPEMKLLYSRIGQACAQLPR